MSVADIKARAEITKINPAVNNRILILDVETVKPKYEIRAWRRKIEHYASYDECIIEKRVTLACWWWYDRPEIEHAAEWDKGGRNVFLRKLHREIEKADIVVAHNGLNADEPWLLGDFTVYRKGAPGQNGFRRLPELPPHKSVDTLRTMRSARYKGIEFKDLDSVGKMAGHDGKTDRYDFRLMDSAIAGDPEAQQTLTDYCAGDVALQRFVYDWLRPGMANHPHMHVDGQAAWLVCNRCAHADTLETAKRYQANVMSYSMLRCAVCTGYRRLSWAPDRISAVRGV